MQSLFFITVRKRFSVYGSKSAIIVLKRILTTLLAAALIFEKTAAILTVYHL